MDVNRSGYYKWRSRRGKVNRYEQDRAVLTQLLREAHEKHPSHGYHRLARAVFNQTGWVFSDHLAHQCCKQAGIRSKARKYTYHPSFYILGRIRQPEAVHIPLHIMYA